MYKRAFMYSSNAPLTLDELDDREDEKHESSDLNKVEDKLEQESTIESEAIKAHPGNKVSYCVFCKGKTFLNEESVNKHLKSKNHLKNVKKNEKEVEKGKKIKKEFLKRMIEVDNKALI